MSAVLDKVCLSCTLDICDDRSAECKFVQIKSNKKKRRKKATAAETKLKDDIIAILGRLVGEKAVENAKRNAASMELVNGEL